MRVAYLGLGSNLGDRRAHLQGGVDGLHAADGTRVTGCSPVYETEAHTTTPDEEQPPFLNAVVQVAVEGTPERLLRRAQRLERAAGRKPDRDRWAPRPLDIDLLMVGDATRQTDDLVLPHPRLGDRRFVLRPWADLAPDVVVPPPFDARVRDLLRTCSDTAALRRTELALRPQGADDPA